MTDAAEKFCDEGRPFRYRRLGDEWSVVDVTGYEVAHCPDEDAAATIVEALNEER